MHVLPHRVKGDCVVDCAWFCKHGGPVSKTCVVTQLELVLKYLGAAAVLLPCCSWDVNVPAKSQQIASPARRWCWLLGSSKRFKANHFW